jgi:acyl carrier protein
MDDAVFSRVAAVCRRTFRDPDARVTRDTTSDDIAGWDSLAHVAFIAAVESEFGVRFSIAEVAGLDSIGDLVDLVDVHMGKRA